MKLNTLARHPRTGHLLVPVGYRRNGKPIWPILGGSEPPAPPTPPGPPTPPTPPASPVLPTPPTPAPNGNATDEQGNDLGFPANTAVAEMSDRQAAAYWRNQSKVQQGRVPSDLAELQRKAAELDQLRASQRTDAEKAADEARDAGRSEGRTQVAQEAAQEFLRAQLAVGRTDEQVNTLMRGVSAAGFVGQDAKVDYSGIRLFAATLGGPAGGGDLDIGNGRRGGTGKPSVAAGRSLHADRHPSRAGGGTNAG